MIIENGVKRIRMGWENDFVNKVILSDGTVLQNMQFRLDATIPSDEELDRIDKENMKETRKQSKEDILYEFERKECELREITEMLWLVYEDYYALRKDDLYTKANNYDRLETYLINIHSLLYARHKEMEGFINKINREVK